MKMTERKVLKKGLNKAAEAVMKASEALTRQVDKLRQTEMTLAELSRTLEYLPDEKKSS